LFFKNLGRNKAAFETELGSIDSWNYKVSVIIPTSNAEEYIEELLQVLQNQTRNPDEIIVIDSESNDKTRKICDKFDTVTFIEIKRSDFDHGKTRDQALQISVGDFILFLTQDAIPADRFYIENILRPFEDESIAMATGRQVARPNASYIERFTREFNYPEQGFVRGKKDIPRLGIKTFFSSNCCSAYRRTSYNEVGGFPAPVLFGEDMIIAAKFIYAGFKVAYQSDARVIHSHEYSVKRQYSRNFDTAVNIAMHSEFFIGISPQPEGVRMVKFVLKNLLKKGRILDAIYYCFECAAKLQGYRHGSNYLNLSKKKILKKTLNKSFWEKEYSHDINSKLCSS
jgi:rhamnosyltransferase